MQLYARGRDTRSGHLIIDELIIVTKHSPYFSLFNSSFFFFLIYFVANYSLTWTTFAPSSWSPLFFLYKSKTGNGIWDWIPESINSQNDAVMGMAVGLSPFPIYRVPRWDHKALHGPPCHLHWEKWMTAMRLRQGNCPGWGDCCRGTDSAAAPLEKVLCSNF